MFSFTRWRVPALAFVLVSSFAMPAAGYVVFLKDGNQIIAKEKYRIEGDQALFERQSGVTSSVPLAEIDVERTDRENLVTLSGVQVIEGMEAVDLANATPPPPPPDSISDALRRAGEGGGLRLPEPRKRATSTTTSSEVVAGPARTLAGYVDLARLARRPYPSTEVGTALDQYFEGQGVETIGVFEGTAPRQPFVEILAPSESAVFKALEESANALLQVRESHPGQVDALEILMVSKAQGAARAGQFQLTPELADLLASGSVAPPAFFLRYVEF